MGPVLERRIRTFCRASVRQTRRRLPSGWTRRPGHRRTGPATGPAWLDPGPPCGARPWPTRPRAEGGDRSRPRPAGRGRVPTPGRPPSPEPSRLRPFAPGRRLDRGGSDPTGLPDDTGWRRPPSRYPGKCHATTRPDRRPGTVLGVLRNHQGGAGAGRRSLGPHDGPAPCPPVGRLGGPHPAAPPPRLAPARSGPLRLGPRGRPRLLPAVVFCGGSSPPRAPGAARRRHRRPRERRKEEEVTNTDKIRLIVDQTKFDDRIIRIVGRASDARATHRHHVLRPGVTRHRSDDPEADMALSGLRDGPVVRGRGTASPGVHTRRGVDIHIVAGRTARCQPIPGEIRTRASLSGRYHVVRAPACPCSPPSRRGPMPDETSC